MGSPKYHGFLLQLWLLKALVGSGRIQDLRFQGDVWASVFHFSKRQVQAPGLGSLSRAGNEAAAQPQEQRGRGQEDASGASHELRPRLRDFQQRSLYGLGPRFREFGDVGGTLGSLKKKKTFQQLRKLLPRGPCLFVHFQFQKPTQNQGNGAPRSFNCKHETRLDGQAGIAQLGNHGPASAALSTKRLHPPYPAWQCHAGSRDSQLESSKLV